MANGKTISENSLNELKKNTDILSDSFEAVGLQVINMSWKLRDDKGRFECFVEVAGELADQNNQFVSIRLNIYDNDNIAVFSQASSIVAGKFSGYDTLRFFAYKEGTLFKACKGTLFVEQLKSTGVRTSFVAGGDIAPVEKEIPTLKANQAGLYPHEILAIEYAPKIWIGENKYQGFWWYQYGVKDVKSLLDSLLARGFVKEGSVFDSLQAYDFNELRRKTKELGIKAGGTRADIINRLSDSVSVEKLGILFPRRSYAVTEKGKEAIKDDGYVMFIHQHPNYGHTIYSMNRLLNGNTRDYQNRLFEQFQKQMLEHLQQSNYGLYRNDLMNIAGLIIEFGQFKSALTLYEEVAYWDLSGLGNGKLNLEMSAQFWFPYDKTMLKIAPFIIQRIKECKEKLEMTDDDFYAFSQNVMNNLSAPFHVFMKEEVIRIIVCEMNNDLREVSGIFEIAKQRLQQKYPQISFERRSIW